MSAIRVEFRFSDGSLGEREWRMEDNPPSVDEALPWVENPRKSWPHPQDPITFTADVKPECEAEVRAWLTK